MGPNKNHSGLLAMASMLEILALDKPSSATYRMSAPRSIDYFDLLSLEAPPEPIHPWEPKKFGRKTPKGSSFESQRSSPRFRKTKHGSMKRK